MAGKAYKSSHKADVDTFREHLPTETSPRDFGQSHVWKKLFLPRLVHNCVGNFELLRLSQTRVAVRPGGETLNEQIDK